MESPPTSVIYVAHDLRDGYSATLHPDASDEDIARGMVAIFAAVAERPNLNLMQFQMKMAQAMGDLSRREPTVTASTAAARGEGSE